jgi:16S rRNA (cytidine1402-2'-O)-methyltransferase
MRGTLFVVATPIGNLEDITLRALRVLREVSVIAAEDTRRTAQLLARHAIRTPTTSLHEHNEGRKSPAILARLEAGESVALVSDAGSPAISDPGAHLVRQALAAGLRVEPIPGPSAVLATLSVSGMATDSFVFLGFPPTRSSDRKTWLRGLAAHQGTIVFFESPHRIQRTLAELRANIGDSTILVARELTKAHEELVKCTISEAIDRLSEPKGEFTVALELGHKTDTAAPSVSALDGSRRKALAALARSYGISSHDLYYAIATIRKSCK